MMTICGRQIRLIVITIIPRICVSELEHSDGLLVWISIGIDATANRDSNVSYAAYLAADG